jgi:hypothetical protein
MNANIRVSAYYFVLELHRTFQLVELYATVIPNTASNGMAATGLVEI